jgi:hypothetical protein
MRYLYQMPSAENTWAYARGQIKGENSLDIANKKRNTAAVLRETGDGDCNHTSFGISESFV